MFLVTLTMILCLLVSSVLCSQVHLVLSQASLSGLASSSPGVQSEDRGTGDTGSPHTEMELKQRFSDRKVTFYEKDNYRCHLN